MKKIVIGMGIFLAGVIIFCTNYIVNSIVDNLPDVTIAEEGMLGSISVIIIIVGGILASVGYFEKKDR